MSDTGLISVLLLVNDGGHPSRSAMTTVVVNITGVNDNQPYFYELEKNITLVEGLPAQNFYTAVVCIKSKGMYTFSWGVESVKFVFFLLLKKVHSKRKEIASLPHPTHPFGTSPFLLQWICLHV